MIIPIYIKRLLKSARYEFSCCTKDPDYAPGYTLSIPKRSDYQTAKVFRSEIERFQRWVNRQPGGVCKILSVPGETHHTRQTAVVTIYDPVMIQLEKLINYQ